MKLSKNKIGIISIILALLIICISSIPAYASPTITILAPNTGFYLNNDAITYRALVSGNPTSVTVKYGCRQSINNNTFVEQQICTLSREGTTNYWSYTTTVNSFYFPWLNSYAPNLNAVEPYLIFVATDSSGTTKVNRQTRLAYASLSQYRVYDPNCDKSKLTSTATGREGVSSTWTYNCMAFALNRIAGGWLWPWSSNPTESQLRSTMNSYGYTNQSSTPLSGAQVIYYEGGHFSKVVAWNGSTGLPAAIESKWGGLERIRSTSATPFDNGPYGHATWYFKQ